MRETKLSAEMIHVIFSSVWERLEASVKEGERASIDCQTQAIERPARSRAAFGNPMTAVMRALIVSLLLSWMAHDVSAATPNVTLTQNSANIGRYDIYELTMANPATYANPWEDVTINATMTSPSGKTYSVGGFSYDGAHTWKLRFAPMETGNWTWTLSYNDGSGVYNSSGGFSSVASSNSGFVRLHPANPYNLRTEGDGRTFYLLGLNHGGGEVPNSNPIAMQTFLPGTANANNNTNSTYPVDFGTAMSTYAANGFNLYRLAEPDPYVITSFNYNNGGKNIYDAHRSQILDASCVVMHTSKLKLQLGFYANPLIHVPNYDLSNPALRQAWLRYHQYFINRFGAYVDIWELMNEASGVPNSYYDIVTQYVRSNDPYQHIITASFPPATPQALIEATSPHMYPGYSSAAEEELFLDRDLASYCQFYLTGNPNRPLQFGEIGMSAPVPDVDLPLEEIFRIWIWCSFFNQASVMPSDNYVGNGRPTTGNPVNMFVGTTQRAHARIWSAYVADFDPIAMPVSKTLAPTGQIRGYMLGSSQDIGGWFVHTTSHTTLLSGATVTLNIPASGMSGQWIDPATGNVIQSFTPGSGSQTLTIPNFMSDIALRIRGGSGPVGPAITQQPQNQSVNAGQTATFSVSATGTAPLSYQWQKNGVNISGATSSSYTTPATAVADSGSAFRCVVMNSVGSATSNSATLTVNPVAQLTLTAAPSSVVAGGTITVTWSGASNTTVTDWISIFSVGAPNTSYGQWQYTNGATGGTMTFTAPSSAGQYEFRYLYNDGYTSLATSNVVVVTAVNHPPVITSPASASPNPANVGQSVSFSVAAGDSDGDTLSYSWAFGDGATAGGATASHTFAAAGTYTATVTVNDGHGGTVTSSVAVTVNQTAVPSIVASPSSVAAGGTVTVAVANGPANATDWVGMYHAGNVAVGQYIIGVYLNGSQTTPPAIGVASATLTFTMPTAAGDYVFGYFANDAFNLLATSNTVTVVSGGGPTTVILQDGLNGYSGTRDTYLGKYSPGSNFGTGTSLYASVANGTLRPLVRFAIFQSEGGPVPNGAAIQSATLSLNRTTNYPSTLTVNRVLKDWTESGASWNNANASTPWTTAGAAGAGTDINSTADATVTTKSTSGWIDFDVTSGVASLSSAGANFGWRILSNLNVNYDAFNSREYAANPTLRPKLSIIYQTGSVAASVSAAPVAPIDLGSVKVNTPFKLKLPMSDQRLLKARTNAAGLPKGVRVGRLVLSGHTSQTGTFTFSVHFSAKTTSTDPNGKRTASTIQETQQYTLTVKP